MSLNQITILGNLTKEPEFLTTNNGISVCRFTVAVSRNFRGADGEAQTDFIPVVTWRGLADSCNKYLKKGNKCLVSGSLQTRTYEANDGQKRYVFEVMANSVEFLTQKQEKKEEPSQKQEAMHGFEPVDDDNLPF